MSTKLQVTVWGENVHEQKHQLVRDIYPQGMHQCIADCLNEDQGIEARTATLQQPEHGLTEEVLAHTDVLTWWGHAAHAEVDDKIVTRVQERVWQGMGLVALHSSHHSKIFEALMGTTCNLLWREAGELERLWVINPGHPIAQGVGPYFEIEEEEMYGEPFGIPTPDEQIFISWFKGGEVFRSGCTWKRGNGKIVYFRPGHETYPTYHNPNVRQVIKNAVRWARPEGSMWRHLTRNITADMAPEPLVVKGGSVHDDSGHIA